MSVRDTAEFAARAGGDVLRGFFDNGVAVREKAAADLVSDADLEAEQVIAQAIRAQYPDHAILGEETLDGAIDAEHLWIVDPLDGTTNFVHHIPHFAVSIAYYRRGAPECGVIWNPIRRDLFTAARGKGAWHNGQPAAVTPATTMSEVLIAVGFYYDRGAMMESTLAALADCFREQIRGIRRMGTASLDLCQVGTGSFGAFFEYELSPWDFAAGRLFVEEAGGRVTTGRGEALPLGKTSLCASNGALHERMLAIVNRHHP